MATLDCKVQVESTLAGSTVRAGSVRSLTVTEATEKKFLASTTAATVWTSAEALGDLDFILVECLDSTIGITVQLETAAGTKYCFTVAAQRPLLIPCTKIDDAPATDMTTAVDPQNITTLKVKAASGTPLVRVILAS